eukprot:TRINITY_DN11043_c0_g1_i1.p1 TRINITY_DN11043_c0_g1~~TRINITY_DN11043_c0_g1_i1.p1  ORF type:complete len:571 (-),score=54.04 TRINITY_DN11043_c0_g1_i1:25-1620(-)
MGRKKSPLTFEKLMALRKSREQSETPSKFENSGCTFIPDEYCNQAPPLDWGLVEWDVELCKGDRGCGLPAIVLRNPDSDDIVGGPIYEEQPIKRFTGDLRPVFGPWAYVDAPSAHYVTTRRSMSSAYYKAGKMMMPEEQWATRRAAWFMKKMMARPWNQPNPPAHMNLHGIRASVTIRLECDSNAILRELGEEGEKVITEHDVFRTVEVPADIDLHTLAEKVLLPAMGWCGDNHAWAFVVQDEDGAVFGPAGCDTIDWMSRFETGIFACADASKVTLANACVRAQMFVDQGETRYNRLRFLYDFGDQWWHTVSINNMEKIGSLITLYAPKFLPEFSHITGGEKACPPEDSSGLIQQGMKGYYEGLMPSSKGVTNFNPYTVVQAANANSILRPGRKGPTYDLNYFDMEAAARRINQALLTPGFKKLEKPKPPPGVHPDRVAYSDPIRVFTPDFTRQIMCARCKKKKTSQKKMGKCSGCRSAHYCTPQCQKQHWKQHKRVCHMISKGNKREQQVPDETTPLSRNIKECCVISD